MVKLLKMKRYISIKFSVMVFFILNFSLSCRQIILQMTALSTRQTAKVVHGDQIVLWKVTMKKVMNKAVTHTAVIMMIMR